MNPLVVDQQFFTALVAGDVNLLQRILTDDFILIDVMSGSENTKPAFLAFVGSGQIKFEAIRPADQRVRLCQDTAVITGRTEMRGRIVDSPFVTSSRYTHVYVQQQNDWRLASAQGTAIAPPPT